jgi:hypothetical protein
LEYQLIKRKLGRKEKVDGLKKKEKVTQEKLDEDKENHN